MQRLKYSAVNLLAAVLLSVGAADVAAKFISPDPVPVDTKAAQNFNRYAYAANSPYRFTDPDGREIVAVDSNQRLSIEALINDKSASSYKFNNQNELRKSGQNDNSRPRSAEYSSRIDEAIKSDKSVYIAIAADFKGENIVEQGGITAKDNVGNAAVVISGESSAISTMPTPVSPANILAHELVGHAIPHVVGGGTGNAVQNENIVRLGAGDLLRPEEPEHCATCER